MKIFLHDIIKIVIISSLLALSGCSFFSPVKLENKSTYVLNSLPSSLPKKAMRPITILVLTPETRPAYNTMQMAYTVKPYQLAYFTQNQWAETPSQMLQPLIVQTLQNTHLFHAVVSPPFMGRYDYVLATEILQLQQDFSVKPSRVDIKLRAQLTNSATNTVIATREFTVNEHILQRTPYGGVLAANRGTQTLLRELAHFCTDKIR